MERGKTSPTITDRNGGYSNGYRYYHQNEHGDIEYITGKDGKIENAYTYDAFGNITNSAEIVRNRYTYNGEQYDQVTNSSCGQPLLRTGEKLPDDLKLFYEKCGGVKFNNTRFQFEIVSPKEMVLANPIIVGELCEEDISSEWYIIGKDNENNYISIDLGEKRIGRCYDSFWDRHGVVGECSVIARSFTELLWNFIYSQGDDNPYWLEDDFNYIGDAYDDL